MKKIYIYLLATTSIMGVSCSEDWLNLNPSTSVTTDQALSTLEDIKVALNGVYRETSQHSYYGDNYWYYGDCRAMDVQARENKASGKRVTPYYTYNVLATDNLNITLPWSRPYLVIRQANNIIQKIEQGAVQSSDTKELDRIKAEALVLRGLALFNLTRLFGMPYINDNGASLGVPIELKPEEPSHQPKRNTVAECYEQVVNDITTARSSLSTERTDGYINYWAAQALLSRVYLDMGKNKETYEAAADVINNSKGLYQLYTRDEYPTIWGKDFQAEALFELYISTTEPSEWGGGTGGEGAPMVYANEEKGVDWNNLILTEEFLNLLEEDPNDVRHCITQLSLIENNEGLPEAACTRKVFLSKFPGKSGDPKDNNISIIRLSEVYLNAAEAGVKLGGEYLEPARGFLNQIVGRANPEKSVSAEEFTIERVLKECRKELVGEGQIFFDYLRNKQPIVRKGGWHLSTLNTLNAETIQPNDPRIALPIPQSEIDANPNIVQNPQ